MFEITPNQIAETAKNLIDKGYKGKVIVAYVDLLGFSQEIKDKWNDTSDDPLKRIMEIKAFIDLAKKGSVHHTFYDYDEQTILGKTKYPDVITISDAFIFIQIMEEDDDLNFILGLLAITGSIIELWKIAKDKGFTIRGGVDFGELFYTTTEVIGPAFIEAYNLESKTADVSRIIYSTKISKMIYAKQSNLHPTLKDYLMRYFKQDIDDCIILNPLIPFGFSIDANLDIALYDFNDLMNNVNNYKARNKYVTIVEQLYKRNRALNSMEIFNK
jgi:hypothetical protein